jgi:hypothetical protein
MKKKIYYLCFVLLGAMIGFFIHAMVEIFYIRLLLVDFDKYGFGWSWSVWEQIHMYGVVALIFGFGYWGYNRGRHFWQVLYIDQKYSKWLGKLKQNF